MRKVWWLVLFLLIGCDARPDMARSQVTKIAVQWARGDNSKLKDDNIVDAVDPWGNNYTWEVKRYISVEEIIIRSSGPDNLLYTTDDIFARRYRPTRAIRNATKEATIGVREGLKEKID